MVKHVPRPHTSPASSTTSSWAHAPAGASRSSCSELDSMLGQVAGGGPADEPSVLGGPGLAKLERLPVRHAVHARLARRRAGEGDQRPLGVQQHVEQHVGQGPAAAPRRVGQVILAQPLRGLGQGPVLLGHRRLGRLDVIPVTRPPYGHGTRARHSHRPRTDHPDRRGPDRRHTQLRNRAERRRCARL